jgi:hypothetical protein
MMDPATKSLFAEIKRLVPGIPDHCKRVELILSMNEPPQVRCDFIVKGSEASDIEEHHKRYTLSEIEP